MEPKVCCCPIENHNDVPIGQCPVCEGWSLSALKGCQLLGMNPQQLVEFNAFCADADAAANKCYCIDSLGVRCEQHSSQKADPRQGYVGPTYTVKPGETVFCLRGHARIEVTNEGRDKANIRFCWDSLFKCLSGEAKLKVTVSPLGEWHKGSKS